MIVSRGSQQFSIFLKIVELFSGVGFVREHDDKGKVIKAVPVGGGGVEHVEEAEAKVLQALLGVVHTHATCTWIE